MESTTGGFFQTFSLHVLAQTAVSPPHFLPPALLSVSVQIPTHPL